MPWDRRKKPLKQRIDGIMKTSARRLQMNLILLEKSFWMTTRLTKLKTLFRVLKAMVSDGANSLKCSLPWDGFSIQFWLDSHGLFGHLSWLFTTSFLMPGWTSGGLKEIFGYLLTPTLQSVKQFSAGLSSSRWVFTLGISMSSDG